MSTVTGKPLRDSPATEVDVFRIQDKVVISFSDANGCIWAGMQVSKPAWDKLNDYIQAVFTTGSER